MKVSFHVCINIAIDNIGRVLKPRCKALSEADLLEICEGCGSFHLDCHRTVGAEKPVWSQSNSYFQRILTITV